MRGTLIHETGHTWSYKQWGTDETKGKWLELNGCGMLMSIVDAARFLEMIYTNNWMKLEVGKGRYGFMLGEDGMVMDDGVSARIADDHYYMTTTTGGAAHVLNWMERWLQTEWPEL